MALNLSVGHNVLPIWESGRAVIFWESKRDAIARPGQAGDKPASRPERVRLQIDSSNSGANPYVLRFKGRVKRLEAAFRSVLEERLIRQSAAECVSRTVIPDGFSHSALPLSIARQPEIGAEPRVEPGSVDPMYLLGCHALWELTDDATAAWEVISAARSPHKNTRAHALSLLSNSQRMTGGRISPVPAPTPVPAVKPIPLGALRMKTPYGLKIINNCSDCSLRRTGFICDFPQPVVASLDLFAQHNILPGGAQLFVEGQEARGAYFICSGRVKLTTASREGKTLMLRMAMPGTAIGLSAALTGSPYQMTAETATPCQVVFLDSRALQAFMRKHAEVGVKVAQTLSQDFQAAYREIHDLILTRSSEGKLVRLLLAAAPSSVPDEPEVRLQAPMTHEEMAQRIGSSRETVTRLLSNLKKRQLLRQDGSTLVIMNLREFESLAV